MDEMIELLKGNGEAFVFAYASPEWLRRRDAVILRAREYAEQTLPPQPRE